MDDAGSARLRAALGSALFLVVAPGTVAGLGPWLITRWSGPAPQGWSLLSATLGWLLIAGGSALLLHAFLAFVVKGLGTPAPVAPTRTLVVSGAYRWVRNPMYLAVLAVIVGQALMLASWPLVLYAAAIAAAFVTFVHFYEEPTLRRQFGTDYQRYLASVPGWLPMPPKPNRPPEDPLHGSAPG